jgi:asparagine synthase (glutamine-hydrolysing)
VEGFDAWGVAETLRRSTGMFAIAAWDERERTLTLARDRFGEKPLYWHRAGDTLVFGSELRALRAWAPAPFEIDDRALASVLRWSFVPQPHTVYRGVHQLGPGRVLTARLDAGGRLHVEESVWWSLADTLDEAIAARPATHDLAEATDELEELFAAAVACRMESDVPLGAFLSGGIDSSLVAAMAQRALGDRRLRTFTVKIPQEGLDESAHAERTARHLGTDHTTVELSLREALDLIPRLPVIWDEPFADPSMLPTALLCQAARHHQTVCLAGDGGDELFAGYNRHAAGALIWDRTRWVPGPARRALGRTMLAVPAGGYDRALRSGHRVLPQRLHIPAVGDKVQKAGRMLAGRHDLWASLAGVWPEGALSAQPHEPWVPELRSPLDPLDEVLLRDTASVLTDQMLVKVDRASMASSLEVRVPFVDERLLAWSWRQPIHVKTRRGTGKVVLRELARRILPPEVAGRPKLGFDPPMARWLRSELHDWAGDLLGTGPSSRLPVSDWGAVQRIWDEHRSGDRNHEYRLWGVLSTLSWLAEYDAGRAR